MERFCHWTNAEELTATPNYRSYCLPAVPSNYRGEAVVLGVAAGVALAGIQ